MPISRRPAAEAPRDSTHEPPMPQSPRPSHRKSPSQPPTQTTTQAPEQAHTQAEQSSVTSYGQVIEYIEDRIYLASYTQPPDENTPFPYPLAKTQSPRKRSSRAQTGPQSAPTKLPAPPRVYFNIDQTMLYNAFFADFGPLHIGHLYRFAVTFHNMLGDPANEGKVFVFWSSPDSRHRANAACLLAAYMVLIQSWPPHLALAPISQMDPPVMPFRDAGYSQADYSLTIQDVVYGVWKAKEEGLMSGIHEFNLEEYEKFERVDMGDFNWISPHFVAFASPQHQPTHLITSSDPLYATLPRSISAVHRDKSIPTPFKNVLTHFAERGIGLVVRLNSELYSPSYFHALGIKHLDMIFDDGTCPTLDIVRKFISLAYYMIHEKRKGIAVHCKAGLGRTGCLIGAYLIYRYGFTANECMAYMRVMRPGMLVGPQQHWLHLNQGTFREWWYEDTMKAKIMASMQPATPTRLQQSNSKRLASNGQTFTPPHGDRRTNSPRRALGEITNNEGAPTPTAVYNSADDVKGSRGVADENLPAPTPGQPRKTNKLYGGSRRIMTENQPFDIKKSSETIDSQASIDASESEEERALRMLARKASQSPLSRSGKRRAVSCTTTTTTTTKWDVPTDTSDTENRPEMIDEADIDMAERVPSPSRPKTPSVKSGNGIGSLSVNKRSSPIRRSTEGKTSVRKTSGRVGSASALGSRVQKSS